MIFRGKGLGLGLGSGYLFKLPCFSLVHVRLQLRVDIEDLFTDVL
jgi:hypothetical protein